MHHNDHFEKHQLPQQPPLIFSRKQVKLWNHLRQLPVQHFLFWVFVFVVTFNFISVVAFRLPERLEHPFFDPGLAVFNPIQEQAIGTLGWIVLQNSLIYCVVMAIPVYFAYWLLYVKRIQERLIRQRANLIGWRLHIFLIFSLVLSFFLAFPTKILLNRIYHDDITGLLGNDIRILQKIDFFPLFLVLLILVFCTTSISFSKNFIDKMRLKARVERRRVQKIIWQLRPHFIFNMLANIQALAEIQSPLVPLLIKDFAKLYRFVLDEGDKDLVPLEKAIGFLEGYLSLAKLGLNRKVDFQITIDDAVPLHIMIPPFALQVIGENCFKHFAKGKDGKGLIHIRLTLDKKGNVLFQTTNTYQPKTTKKEPGAIKKSLGLRAIKEQLDLVYDNKYSLMTQEDLDHPIFEVTLLFPPVVLNSNDESIFDTSFHNRFNVVET